MTARVLMGVRGEVTRAGGVGEPAECRRRALPLLHANADREMFHRCNDMRAMDPRPLKNTITYSRYCLRYTPQYDTFYRFKMYRYKTVLRYE